MAGMHGYSFMQVFEGITVTDLFKKRSFLVEDKYRIITCPYTGKDVVTVRLPIRMSVLSMSKERTNSVMRNTGALSAVCRQRPWPVKKS
jgi:hypothetical protein